MKSKFIFLIILLFLAASCQKVPSSTPSTVSSLPKETHIMTVTSPEFADGATIPAKYSCKGENINPPLEISGVSADAKSLALVLHDPDAPAPGGFTHWVIYNMPPATNSILENSTPPGTQGANGAGKTAYTGPCPPSGTHHYRFTVYELDDQLSFNHPPTKTDMENAMQGHILDQADLVGLFSK